MGRAVSPVEWCGVLPLPRTRRLGVAALGVPPPGWGFVGAFSYSFTISPVESCLMLLRSLYLIRPPDHLAPSRIYPLVDFFFS